jgi:translation elongation factor EF-G
MFRGSGINLMDGIYDIHFKCTADQKRNIMAFINRNYGKIIKKITRKDKNGYYE